MKTKFLFALILLSVFFSCEKGAKLTKDSKETVVTGTTTILVDETIFPIVEDVVAVFENEYKNARIKLISKPEGEIISLLKEDKAKIAILPRNLNDEELDYYTKKKIIPRITEFAEDAVVFITNKENNLPSLNKDDLASKLKGKSSVLNQRIVFENPNSSIINFVKNEFNLDQLDSNLVYSMNNSKELIKFIADNKDAVGVIGVNWLLQPSVDIEREVQNVKIIGFTSSLQNGNQNVVFPNQSNIADHSYPWTRKLYLLNFQGANGLGMGFASYIAGENGQRIILKSGLSPKKVPSREINVKGSIE
ncbi:substrate-binding domain-containing protein [Flavobacterium sp. HXWNR69]|uniref:Substrate-binding domain-containing protein n=1 Tax=Flavobacterium fragile TaxID=2949085 RepID=A0ABT0TJL3_9FLAO|nr:substrate-binding domain-containing protein [Flavobacterium sp. HXWNR69]MCL9771003.1 substrate-binding domain-containing protein [Flavobacterium sp. HXWNR69]